MKRQRSIHLAAGGGRTRCNREGMRSNRAGVAIAGLAVTNDPERATCADCVRLAGVDAKARPASETAA